MAHNSTYISFTAAYLVLCTLLDTTNAFRNLENPRFMLNKRSNSKACINKDYLDKLLDFTEAKNFAHPSSILPLVSESRFEKFPGSPTELLKHIYDNLFVRFKLIKDVLRMTKDEPQRIFYCDLKGDEHKQNIPGYQKQKILGHHLNSLKTLVGQLKFDNVKPWVSRLNLDESYADQLYDLHKIPDDETTFDDYACALMNSDQYEDLRRLIALEEELEYCP